MLQPKKNKNFQKRNFLNKKTNKIKLKNHEKNELSKEMKMFIKSRKITSKFIINGNDLY